MLLGRGDTAKLNVSEKTTLRHLQRLVETGHIVGLEPEQSETALYAIDLVNQWRSVFKLLASLKNIGLLVGVLLGMYWATRGAIISWVTQIGAGN